MVIFVTIDAESFDNNVLIEVEGKIPFEKLTALSEFLGAELHYEALDGTPLQVGDGDDFILRP